jgi:tetratricopeptide (TPR) repeat protein
VLASLLVNLLLLGQLGCQQSSVFQPSVAGLNQRAQQLLSEGRHDDAIARLQSALDLSPNDLTTQYNLAIAYQTANRNEAALPLLEGLRAHVQDAQKDRVLQSLAIAYEAQGDALIQQQATDKKNPPASATNTSQHAVLAKTAYSKAYEALQQVSEAVRKTPATQAQLKMLARLAHDPAPQPTALGQNAPGLE